MGTSPISLSAYGRILRRNRNFRLLWLAQMVSELGDWFYSIAIYSLLLDLTRSAEAVALAVVLQVLPQFFISPMAGVVNDRVSRKKIMILADVARAVIVLGMLLVRTPELVPLLYLLLLLQTFMWSFFEPGRTAVIPVITGSKEDTLVANALSSTTWSFNLAAGSAIGGFVAVAFGRDTVFIVNALTFVVSAMFLRSMRFDEPHTVGSRPFGPRDLVDLSPMIEGLRYVMSNARLVATLLVKAGLGMLGAHWVFLPLFGQRVVPVDLGYLDAERAGMLGMSLLMGSRGVGALIGPLIGGYWAGNDRHRMRQGILIGFCTVGAGYIALAYAPEIVTAALAVILANAGGSLIWVFSTTLLHYQADDRFRGRVFSADFGLMVLTMSSVSYMVGVAVDMSLPLRTASLITGLIAVIPIMLWTGWAMPLWRREPVESD